MFDLDSLPSEHAFNHLEIRALVWAHYRYTHAEVFEKFLIFRTY